MKNPPFFRSRILRAGPQAAAKVSIHDLFGQLWWNVLDFDDYPTDVDLERRSSLAWCWETKRLAFSNAKSAREKPTLFS